MTRICLTSEQEQYIVDNYSTMTSSQLAKILGIPTTKVTNTWQKYNLCGKHSRQYLLNEYYFNNIDSPAKAYYLGLIASDGCLYAPTNGNKQKIIRFAIAYEDKEILEELKRELSTEKPIHPYMSHGRKYVNFEISSNIMYDDIISTGIDGDNKTYKNVIPNTLSDEMFRFFILGYFDGDGSITSKISSGRLHDVGVSITGYEYNLCKIGEYLNSHNILNSFVPDNRHYNKGNGRFGQLVLTNKIQKYSFLKFLYDNNCSCLSRKKNLANQFIHIIENNNDNMAKTAVLYYKHAVCCI